MSNPRRHCLITLKSLKKPQVLLFLPSIFLSLTWVCFRFRHSSHFLSSPQNLQRWSKDDDLKANLVRFLPFQLSKDKRGWMLDPVTAVRNAGLSGGAVTCASASVGEIRPGGIRGNHRHYTCNETFIIWGAQVKFRLILDDATVRIESTPQDTQETLNYVEYMKSKLFELLENSEVAGKGYAEVIIGADEVAVVTSPSGTGHALVNVDPVRTAFRLGCQDGIVNLNSSSTVFNIWSDL